jgi:hypothetical protein
MESIMQVAANAQPLRARVWVGPRDLALRSARTCYDHLAGRLGVALADALVARGYMHLAGDAGAMTDDGIEFLGRIGIAVDRLLIDRGRRSATVLCRPCLDWSERRPHLAGRVGSALCALSLERDWIRRAEGSRAVNVTPKGDRIFRDQFGAQPVWRSGSA